MWELFDMHQYAYGHVVQQATHEQKKNESNFIQQIHVSILKPFLYDIEKNRKSHCLNSVCVRANIT